jgi:NAD(P)-dependent dehydrogenase (short-subunit alcohol dehydrogenase family)
MRTVLVTGSAKRLGECLVSHFAEMGDCVWVHYQHSRSAAEELVSKIKKNGAESYSVQADIRRKEAVVEMMGQIEKHSGRLDVLVNNVGVYLCGDLLGYSTDDFENTIQTNLIGAYYCMNEAIKIMPKGGSIINIGYSGLNSIAAHPNNAAYVASKLGLLSLTKSYAVALGPKEIRCNMVSPGQLDNSVDLPENFDDLSPLGRPGSPDDIAKTVAFLCSEQANYVTGQNIDVAGGYMLELQDHLE